MDLGVTYFDLPSGCDFYPEQYSKFCRRMCWKVLNRLQYRIFVKENFLMNFPRSRQTKEGFAPSSAVLCYLDVSWWWTMGECHGYGDLTYRQ